jgi:mannosyltransferase OCH1-like enzyme
MNNTIPKIIHHIGPDDKNQWHPLWEPCYLSWKEHFFDFEFVMWSDNEDTLGDFVEQYFPEYSRLYCDIPLHICKIDFFKYCLMYVHGGMFVDLDIFCYNNFFDELDNQVHLLQSTLYTATNEVAQNSMMIGVPNHKFFKACVDTSYKRLRSIDSASLIKSDLNNSVPINFTLVTTCTGPGLLSDVYSDYDKTEISLLNYKQFNNHHLSYNDDYRTKHMLTGRWGNNLYKFLEKERQEFFSNLTWKEYESVVYKKFRSIDVNNFDFRKNYI